MLEQKVDMFITANRDCLKSNDVMMLRERMLCVGDEKMAVLQSVDMKSPTTSLILSLFLGVLGIDRFYIGDIGMGILKLLTVGGFGIITLIDWFIIQNRTKKKNVKRLFEVL